MSNTPGISPITTDIEDISHSDEDGFFGDEGEHVVDVDEMDDEDTEKSHEDDQSSRER